MARGLRIFKMLQMIAIVSQRWESLYTQMSSRGIVKAKVSVVQSCPTLWGPMDCSPPGSPSMGFSREQYWSGWPFPSPGDLPNPGVNPPSPILQADSLPSEPPGNPQRVLGLWSSGFLAYWNSLISPEWTTLDFMIQNNERSVKWGTWHMASSLSSSELCKVLFWTLGKRLNSGAGSLLPSALLQAWCVPLAPDHPSHGLASPPWHISHTVSLAYPDPHDARCGLVPKSCPTVCDPRDCSPPGSSVHGISQARTGVGCHTLLQGVFLTRGSNPHLLHWQADSSVLSPREAPGSLQQGVTPHPCVMGPLSHKSIFF